MAITPTAFLERLTAASGDFNKAKVGELGALGAVYLNLGTEVARMGQTIRIPFPDIGAFTDQGAGDWNPDPLNPNFVDVPFAERPGKSILIQDFEQFQTSTDLITQYLDPMFKRALEYANAAIFAQLNTTNFYTTAPAIGQLGVYPSYPPISTFPAQVQIGDVRLAWNLLKRNKVPIGNPADSVILYHDDVHANTLVDTNWYQESLVGAVIASGTREGAASPGRGGNQAFNFRREHDVQAPTAASANLTGTVTVANGSTTVTGSSTTFSSTNAAPVGSWLSFGSDNYYYPVKSVASDTVLTLGQAYNGTLTSGATYNRLTYTGVAMHRYAIALAVRPLDVNTGNAVASRIITLQGIPIRVGLGYPQVKAGWMLTMDYGMVAKVIRPDFGVLLNS
jgi:hypothetical protein